MRWAEIRRRDPKSIPCRAAAFITHYRRRGPGAKTRIIHKRKNPTVRAAERARIVENRKLKKKERKSGAGAERGGISQKHGLVITRERGRRRPIALTSAHYPSVSQRFYGPRNIRWYLSDEAPLSVRSFVRSVPVPTNDSTRCTPVSHSPVCISPNAVL